jgi:hypothetical protein
VFFVHDHKNTILSQELGLLLKAGGLLFVWLNKTDQ